MYSSATSDFSKMTVVALDALHSLPVMEELHILPTMEESCKAIPASAVGRPLGKDGIPPKVL